MNAFCQDCGKHMPSYVVFCYTCGKKATSQNFVYKYTDGATKTFSGRIIDRLSMVFMAAFGGILFLTFGFVMIYYILFYANYLA